MHKWAHVIKAIESLHALSYVDIKFNVKSYFREIYMRKCIVTMLKYSIVDDFQAKNAHKLTD